MIEVLYIHGFASCGQSSKAKYLQSFFNVIAPNLSTHPEEALQQLRQLIQSKGNDELILVGTSLGAWYADEMANEFGLNEILINPLVNPEEMKKFIGSNINYCTNEAFEFTQDDYKFIRNYKRANYRQWQKVIWLSKNDTVLNPEHAKDYFNGIAEITMFSDKDHRFDLIDTNIEEKIIQVHNIIGFIDDD